MGIYFRAEQEVFRATRTVARVLSSRPTIIFARDSIFADRFRILNSFSEKSGKTVSEFLYIGLAAGNRRRLKEQCMAQDPMRAAEYRGRAAAETAAGLASGLDQVRAKHARAAQVWTDLADAEDARREDREARLAAAAPAAAPA